MKNDKSIKNANSILSKSNDDYLMIPHCNSQMPQHELIIHLSEEVAVEQILADNHEDFSANLDQIWFYGSSDYPPKGNKWKKIGEILPKYGEHFHLAEIDPTYNNDKSMIRYLKVIMKSKDQNELYCTLTHVQVFGRSMHLSLVESFKDVNV